jgi:S1 RNA binding domain protein
LLTEETDRCHSSATIEESEVPASPAEETETPAASPPAAPAVETPAETPAAETAAAKTPAPEAPAGEAAPAGPAPELAVGAIIDGTVQRITPYGAFLQLEGGKIGLVHISEIDRNYVKDVREHLREGDVAQAKVIAIKEDGKIDLSIKAMQDPQPRLDRRRGQDPDFEQKLKRFMRQSDERQVDFRRSMDHKRR